jgi:peptidoglycan hydrolase-like protein with peptidoglycan-binding domain
MDKPTLKLGSKGVFVTEWQGLVGAKADGDFGPKTEALTKTWQANHGLVADGIVGLKSWTTALTTKTDPAPPPVPSSPGGLHITFKQAKNYTKGRRPGPIDLIVIHTMEAKEKPTTAEAVAEWGAGPHAPNASWGYAVDSNSIVQSVRDEDTAWHAKGANHNGIGIEHAGYAKQNDADWADEYSLAMLRLSAKLSATLCLKYSIPVVKLTPAELKSGGRGIVGHKDCTDAFTGGRGHTDPGGAFPWQKYLDWIKEELELLQ